MYLSEGPPHVASCVARGALIEALLLSGIQKRHIYQLHIREVYLTTYIRYYDTICVKSRQLSTI